MTRVLAGSRGDEVFSFGWGGKFIIYENPVKLVKVVSIRGISYNFDIKHFQLDRLNIFSQTRITCGGRGVNTYCFMCLFIELNFTQQLPEQNNSSKYVKFNYVLASPFR